jgi:hypothetical protein
MNIGTKPGGYTVALRIGAFFGAVSFILAAPSSLSASEEEFSLEQEASISLEVLESLALLREDPLDINHATYDQLLLIPYLTPVLCLRIIRYREAHPFTHAGDLLHIAGINEQLLEEIKPLISVAKKTLPQQKAALTFRSIFGTTLPKEMVYEGSPFSLSNKLHYTRGTLFAGATTSKNPYESHYADFYTLYAGMKNENLTLIVGDYAMDIGERLISGYPGFVFKSSGMVKGREAVAKPYRSGFEDFAYRGGVLEKRWRTVDAALFFSRHMLDGTFENDTAKRVIYEAGYHRTETELDKKNSIEERSAGASAAFGNEAFNVRTTILSGWYDRHIYPYQAHYYRFSGSAYTLSSLHINYEGSRNALWSEYALSHSTGGAAFILGMKAKPRYASVIMLYRNYGETYYAPRAFAFCETEVRNERGLYSFISANLPLKIHFAGYLDIFTRPFPTYYNVFATSGFETFCSLEKRVMETTLYLRYKYKEKNNFQWLDESLNAVRQSIRCSVKLPLDRRNTLTLLFQGGNFAVPDIRLSEQGYLVSCSIKSGFLRSAAVESGFVLFITDSYDSRMYLFINDIPGALYSRPFYGNGFDGYLLLKMKFGNGLHCYAKFEIEKKEVTERIYRFGLECR